MTASHLSSSDRKSDIDAILSHRKDNGADFWTTPDRRLLKGSPFSTLECITYLLELGMDSADLVLRDSAGLVISAWQEDGRFRLYPHGTAYPCQTIHAASVLCRLGYAGDPHIQKTLQYLLENRHTDGGWRCNKFSFGHGPETEYSNPFPTLIALDAFRFTENPNSELDSAVEFLLSHWTVKKPMGPCHYGIGTLFMQVEYPFRNYNLFVYVYVLSFYEKARKDKRFFEAFEALKSKTVNGEIVVERVVPKLAEFAFCKKGRPSGTATRRYNEILGRLH